MSFVEGVAVRVAYPRAYAALRLRADVKSGETVLVHAGAGGTGIAAIQVAKAFGCNVIATAGNERKVRICIEQGADAAFDYSAGRWLEAVKRETVQRGVDVVVDPVGGSKTEGSVRCLTWNGRFVVVGFAGGAIPSLATNPLLLRNASIAGVYWGGYAKNDPDQLQPVFAAVFEMCRQGKINPVVSEVLPILEAPAAIKWWLHDKLTEKSFSCTKGACLNCRIFNSRLLRWRLAVHRNDHVPYPEQARLFGL